MSIKGIREILEKSAEAAELSNQNRVKYLYLNNGDTASIRFINDEDMVQTKIHEYEEIIPTGKKYRTAYCSQNLFNTPCKWCASGNVSKNVYVFLVYVYNVVRRKQNPALDKDPNATRWTAVKQGNQTVFREDVGGIRLLRVKWGKDSYLKNSIMQLVNAYGTLCDRDYMYSRLGESTKTSYSFVPKDPSKAPAEVANAEKPSIEEALGVAKEEKASEKKEKPSAEKKQKQLDTGEPEGEEVEGLF